MHPQQGLFYFEDGNNERVFSYESQYQNSERMKICAHISSAKYILCLVNTLDFRNGGVFFSPNKICNFQGNLHIEQELYINSFIWKLYIYRSNEVSPLYCA